MICYDWRLKIDFLVLLSCGRKWSYDFLDVFNDCPRSWMGMMLLLSNAVYFILTQLGNLKQFHNENRITISSFHIRIKMKFKSQSHHTKSSWVWLEIASAAIVRK